VQVEGLNAATTVRGVFPKQANSANGANGAAVAMYVERIFLIALHLHLP